MFPKPHSPKTTATWPGLEQWIGCPLSLNLQQPGLPEQAVEAGLNLTAAVITGN